MDKILNKKNFPKWMKALTSYKVYAPVWDEDIWNIQPVEDPETIDLDLNATAVQSPKKIIFPQREVFLEFEASDEDGWKINDTLPEIEPAVIFGVRPCDAKALSLYDLVFGGDFKDNYYWHRRDNTLLVGLTCNTAPSDNCFCTSVEGSPFGTEGLDILLTDMGDRYFVESLTVKGQELLKKGKDIFTAPKPQDKKDLETIKADASKSLTRRLEDAKTIPPVLKGMFDSPFWDDEAMSCLRCGICTYLCPTCHCFDIQDETTSTKPVTGKRVRTWDNCQFPDFTMHSSGHNPRPDKASRLRQRIMHKYQYFPEIYNHYQCTGCGRCISHCPVGIDIIDVLDKVKDHG